AGRNRGDLVTGGGVTGATTLLGALQARPGGAGWRLVPPLCMKKSTQQNEGGTTGKGETVIVFYHVDDVVFLGPEARNFVWEHADRAGDAPWVDTSAVP